MKNIFFIVKIGKKDMKNFGEMGIKFENNIKI
jgi:hypothetical protein